MDVTLLSILHDPSGQLLDPAKIVLPELTRIYKNVVVDITEDTQSDLISYVNRLTIASVNKRDGIGNSRRRVLASGLSNTTSNHFHYCDFDRIIYWYTFFPEELEEYINIIPKFDFIVFGRTQLAFSSHPFIQKLTEWLCDLIFSVKYSDGFTDILSGSRGMSRRVAKIISRYSKAHGAGVDAEWPKIALDSGYPVVDYSVNGLGYESIHLNIQKNKWQEIKFRFENLILTAIE